VAELALQVPLKIGIYSVRTPYRRDSGSATMENISYGGVFLSNLKLEGGAIPASLSAFSWRAIRSPEGLEGPRKSGPPPVQRNGDRGVQFTRVPKESMKMIEALAP